ncbi:MAG: LPS assembly lipoprotein LptE [Puniceicoccales bacterium]|jgi:hypothetical protein|nr:LPS assembly lipoprotein LptE [Puniceicoccales bacterium]
MKWVILSFERVISLSLLAVFSGCHYHRGISPTNNIHSIYVAPVKNSTLCPKASGTLTTQLIKKIQQSTSLKCVPKNEAQGHLQIEIVDFSKKSAALNPSDTSVVLIFNVSVVAECTFIDKEGRYWLEHQRIEAHMDLDKAHNFHSLQDQALPQLMERLARKICALLTNIW